MKDSFVYDAGLLLTIYYFLVISTAAFSNLYKMIGIINHAL